jgi:hypothetical protein
MVARPLVQGRVVLLGALLCGSAVLASCHPNLVVRNPAACSGAELTPEEVLVYRAGLQSFPDFREMEFLRVMSVNGQSPVWSMPDDRPGNPDPETRVALERAFLGAELPAACLNDVAFALHLTPVVAFGDRQVRLTRIVGYRTWRYFQAVVRRGRSILIAGVAVRAVNGSWVLEAIQYVGFGQAGP